MLGSVRSAVKLYSAIRVNNNAPLALVSDASFSSIQHISYKVSHQSSTENITYDTFNGILAKTLQVLYNNCNGMAQHVNVQTKADSRFRTIQRQDATNASPGELGQYWMKNSVFLQGKGYQSDDDVDYS
ncbi:hypothetical protein Tco_0201326 [Tanacetum coccineum]